MGKVVGGLIGGAIGGGFSNRKSATDRLGVADPITEYGRLFQDISNQILPFEGEKLGAAGKVQESAFRQQLLLARTLGPKFERLRQRLIAANPTARRQASLTNKALDLLSENIGPGGLKLDASTNAALRENVRSALAARGGLFSGRGAVTEASNLIQGQLNVQGQRISNVLAALSGTTIPSQTGLSSTFNADAVNPLNISNPGAAISAFPTIYSSATQRNLQVAGMKDAARERFAGAIGGIAGEAIDTAASFFLPGIGGAAGGLFGAGGGAAGAIPGLFA